MPDPDRIVPTEAQLWEQDRALLAEHGHCHIETICGVAAALRAEGKVDEAAELDRQCARMRIIAMDDGELIATYGQSGGAPGDELADLLAVELERRDLDI